MIDKSIIQATSAWPFVEARKLVKERRKIFEKKGKITLQTGYGPSGLPHIGTFAEVVRTTMMVNAIKKIIVRNYSNEDAVDTWVLQKGTECFHLAKIGRKYRDVPLDPPRHAKIEGFLPYTWYAQETSSSSIEGGLKGPMAHDPSRLYVKLRYMDTDNRTKKALVHQIESI